MIDQEKDADAWDATVKGRKRKFVLFYCSDYECMFNATKSYAAAYPGADPNTCSSNGSKLLKNPEVRLACQRLLKLCQQDLDVENTYKLLHDMEMLATFNPAEVLTAGGQLKTKTLEGLGDKAKCVAQIKKGKFGMEYTLVDRTKYMQMLGTYLNLVRPEIEIDRSLPVIALPDKATDEEWNAKAKKEE